ncbi:hypothetical protein HZA56_20200 [Candidatus Poribacteria bacterium]|nr:hypothetical protein [Candidatus Poribacteria bacterium]
MATWGDRRRRDFIRTGFAGFFDAARANKIRAYWIARRISDPSFKAIRVFAAKLIDI